MEYKVLIASNKAELFLKKELENEVEKYIKNGWKPLGGLSMTSIGDKLYLSQAMIKG